MGDLGAPEHRYSDYDSDGYPTSATGICLYMSRRRLLPIRTVAAHEERCDAIRSMQHVKVISLALAVTAALVTATVILSALIPVALTLGGDCSHRRVRGAAQQLAGRMAIFALGLTSGVLVTFWMAARDRASVTVQGWLLLLAGIAWGMIVGFAVKAVSDEAQATRSRQEARLQEEREWRKGLTPEAAAAIH